MQTVGSHSLNQGMGSVVWLLFGDVFTKVHFAVRYPDRRLRLLLFPSSSIIFQLNGLLVGDSRKLDNDRLMVI